MNGPSPTQTAFFWEGNDPRDEGKVTYAELHKEVCKFANVLKSKGVKKGDRVAIYMVRNWKYGDKFSNMSHRFSFSMYKNILVCSRW